MIISCKKKNTQIDEPKSTTSSIITNTFLNATIDSGFVYKSTISEWETSSDIDSIKNLIYRRYASATLDGNNEIVVYFENNQFQEATYNSNENNFLEVFHEGSRVYDSIPFVVSNQRNITVGYYENVNGINTYWTSQLGNQKGSYFNITEKHLLNSSAFDKVYVGGNFNCKVYNIQNNITQSKVITCSSFYLDFVK